MSDSASDTLPRHQCGQTCSLHLAEKILGISHRSAGIRRLMGQDVVLEVPRRSLPVCVEPCQPLDYRRRNALERILSEGLSTTAEL